MAGEWWPEVTASSGQQLWPQATTMTARTDGEVALGSSCSAAGACDGDRRGWGKPMVAGEGSNSRLLARTGGGHEAICVRRR